MVCLQTGKLQEVEQERLQQQEEINRLMQQVMDLEKAVEEALKEKDALADKLESTLKEMEAERRAAEEHVTVGLPACLSTLLCLARSCLRSCFLFTDVFGGEGCSRCSIVDAELSLFAR